MESICNCGAMAKSRQKQVSNSSDPKAVKPTCSCVKNNKKCSRNCRCVCCMNCEEPSKSVASSTTKGCTCGSSKKNSSNIFCHDGLLRKSKCPCLKNNVYCSRRCKCSSCGNKCVDIKGVDASQSQKNPTGIKRKRNPPEPYKRCKGVDYLAKEGFEISVGPWSKLETLTLSVAAELIKSTGLTVSPNSIMEIYNFVACSNKVKELALPIAYKSSKQVLGKLSHINSKHSIFQTLVDSLNEEKGQS